MPRITLDQWATLIHVVESGSYELAAQRLHKSQSILTYALQQLQRLTGVQVFEIRGRKATLTAAGHVRYLRSKRLIEGAKRVQHMAADLAVGWEAKISLAVEIIFPTWLLLECLAKFSEERPQTSIQLYESVLGGTREALLKGEVDIAIGPQIPPDFLGDPLTQVHLVPAAHPHHPLHQLGRPLSLADLRGHRYLVMRETGAERKDEPIPVADQRWTVSNKATSIRAARMGLGFAWYPEEGTREEVESDQLKVLPLRKGADRYANLYLIFADPDSTAPGARRLAGIIREAVKARCPKAVDHGRRTTPNKGVTHRPCLIRIAQKITASHDDAPHAD